jgi:hypothetical protein
MATALISRLSVMDNTFGFADGAWRAYRTTYLVDGRLLPVIASCASLSTATPLRRSIGNERFKSFLLFDAIIR